MTLIQIYQKFPKQKDCINHLEKLCWDNKPLCPYCKTQYSSEMKSENRHHCNLCNTTFSVTVGTIFHKSKVDLQKWFYTIFLLNNGVSFSLRKLSKEISVTKDTSSFMITKIKNSLLKHDIILTKIVESII